MIEVASANYFKERMGKAALKGNQTIKLLIKPGLIVDFVAVLFTALFGRALLLIICGVGCTDTNIIIETRVI